jgi:acyl carrier protein
MREPLDFETFCDLLSVELGMNESLLTDENRLIDDLAFDSLVTFEMLLFVEAWAGVQLPEALIPQLKTMGDVYAVYRTRVTQQ